MNTTQTNEPIIGETWQSQTLNHTFLVLSGPEVKTYSQPDELYCGHRAQRTFDGRVALVGLTKKPESYPYDFLLLQ